MEKYKLKYDQSNEKRLESLKKVRDEYNLKRKLVSDSLKKLVSYKEFVSEF